ncbi:uncharacterized protein CTHT_0054600 [Thermochaetoides thermophila DSM 1495]|uniref:Uncharacterized protein n=1 Tax=Chaetomium thermophilum (strain DSM 1495 / CBS 144.50 / IMI 039719) TaxID=759272 RepID=G0SBS3_CHATD|nr:hypothetical protein CTHT_0054600 [Thermochaetoides thermophila DSM 1495]EGS18849.1 hypothetical protein CTHT_0054600 [Thermochaetoides thermophila DSM 1495]
MANQLSGHSSLPRGFRYSGLDEPPKTPEPLLQSDEAQLPSPPRPRLRVRRRVASQLSAPTQQFLASVAAADIPIPSIEEPEPEILPRRFHMDDDLIPFPELPIETQCEGYLQVPRARPSSPKTPAPELEQARPRKRYPSWSLDLSSSVESTPEPDYESSRPSTSRSTHTSASLFSQFSQFSDEECSEESDGEGTFYTCPLADEEDEEPAETTPQASSSASKTKRGRKAPWTKAMSDHLWSTFLLYLQDPRVTPFRMSKSGIPPDGVCLRVARAAKKSWKGSRAMARAAKASAEGKKSGSATPTADNSSPFIEWPHTCAATRAHLRELCRLKASSRPSTFRFMSRTGTPFTQAAARHWNRRSTPARGEGAFTTRDISVSLALSTAESMQPNGPLAQLAKAGSGPSITRPEPELKLQPEPTPASTVDRSEPSLDSSAGKKILQTFEGEPSFAERRRLGSPFTPSSYGPSSSNSLAAILGLSGSAMPRRQSQSLGSRKTLQSPVRLSRSGAQKRRHTQSGVFRKRPSIGADWWLDPSLANSTAETASSSSTEAGATTRVRDDGIFIPKPASGPPLNTSASMPDVSVKSDTSSLEPPPRLGSPFSVSSSSHSYPHRAHRSHQAGSIDLGVLGRPFATIQPFSSDSNALSGRQTTLADRLAYLDQRLKELNQKGTNARSEH